MGLALPGLTLTEARSSLFRKRLTVDGPTLAQIRLQERGLVLSLIEVALSSLSRTRLIVGSLGLAQIRLEEGGLVLSGIELAGASVSFSRSRLARALTQALTRRPVRGPALARTRLTPVG
jgi:hypothetical protein